MKIISFTNFSDEYTNVYEAKKTERVQKIELEKGKIPVSVPGNNGPELKQLTPAEINKINGVPAKKNGSHGAFAVDEPIEKNEQFFEELEWTDNISEVIWKISSESPFFVQGRAGWAKTSVIKDIARRHGYHVLTLYLDKMPAEDLGGLPYTSEDKKTETATVQYAMPWWAAYMLANENKKFLLFLDEINQASPETLNAVMPICLENVVCNIKFDNFFVGAAGNMKDENVALSEMSDPLLDRFGGVIEWECNWKEAFKYLHKVWDGKIGKELVDLFEKHAENFKSPRSIERNIFKIVHTLKQDIDNGNKIDMKKNLKTNIVAKNIARQTIDNKPEEDYIMELAMECYSYIIGRGVTSQSSNKSDDSKTNYGVQYVANTIREGLIRMDIKNEEGKWENIEFPVAKDNIYKLHPGLNKTVVEAAERKLANDGDTWRYESLEEALKEPKWEDIKEIIKEINEQE